MRAMSKFFSQKDFRRSRKAAREAEPQPTQHQNPAKNLDTFPEGKFGRFVTSASGRCVRRASRPAKHPARPNKGAAAPFQGMPAISRRAGGPTDTRARRPCHVRPGLCFRHEHSHKEGPRLRQGFSAHAGLTHDAARSQQRTGPGCQARLGYPTSWPARRTALAKSSRPSPSVRGRRCHSG